MAKYSYNKSQQDALFLHFILVKNSTCFGQIYCQSSGVLILYSQQLTSMTNTSCFEYIINPLTPNDTYRGRTAPLTSKVAFYIFIQQI